MIPAVHNRRQYVEAPCTDAANDAVTYHYSTGPMGGRLWDEGATYHTPYTIAAGATV